MNTAVTATSDQLINLFKQWFKENENHECLVDSLRDLMDDITLFACLTSTPNAELFYDDAVADYTELYKTLKQEFIADLESSGLSVDPQIVDVVLGGFVSMNPEQFEKEMS